MQDNKNKTNKKEKVMERKERRSTPAFRTPHKSSRPTVDVALTPTSALVQPVTPGSTRHIVRADVFEERYEEAGWKFLRQRHQALATEKANKRTTSKSKRKWKLPNKPRGDTFGKEFTAILVKRGLLPKGAKAPSSCFTVGASGTKGHLDQVWAEGNDWSGIFEVDLAESGKGVDKTPLPCWPFTSRDSIDDIKYLSGRWCRRVLENMRHGSRPSLSNPSANAFAECVVARLLFEPLDDLFDNYVTQFRTLRQNAMIGPSQSTSLRLTAFDCLGLKFTHERHTSAMLGCILHVVDTETAKQFIKRLLRSHLHKPDVKIAINALEASHNVAVEKRAKLGAKNTRAKPLDSDAKRTKMKPATQKVSKTKRYMPDVLWRASDTNGKAQLLIETKLKAKEHGHQTKKYEEIEAPLNIYLAVLNHDDKPVSDEFHVVTGDDLQEALRWLQLSRELPARLGHVVVDWMAEYDKASLPWYTACLQNFTHSCLVKYHVRRAMRLGIKSKTLGHWLELHPTFTSGDDAFDPETGELLTATQARLRPISKKLTFDEEDDDEDS